MRIGLLTLPLETGYGSIMQAYALKSILEKQGHEVYLIRRHIKKRRFIFSNIIKRFVKKYIFHKKTLVFYDKKVYDEFPIITKNTQLFINQYLKPFTPLYYSSKEFEDVKNFNFDAIIVGSDQVWRPGCMENVLDYFLTFIDTSKTKLISYAASFGVNEWKYTAKQTEIAKKKLKSFVGVSVREKSGVSLCKKYLDCNAKFVLDPTMLLSINDYIKLIGDKNSNVEKYKNNVTAFILDRTEDKAIAVDKLCKSMQCSYNFACNNTEDRFAPLNERIAPEVSDWLKSLYYSRFVFTDSFHGCAFCIIFNKPFILYVNEGRGSARFDSLLSLFRLKDRIITNSSDIDSLPINEAIDWDIVNKIRKDMIFESMSFLKSSLS